jgi:hypothetical protein
MSLCVRHKGIHVKLQPFRHRSRFRKELLIICLSSGTGQAARSLFCRAAAASREAVRGRITHA